MKCMIFGVAALMLSPTVASAQTVPSAPAVPASLDADTPIETLYASTRGKEVLARNLPDLDKHPSYDTFKGMSVRQIAPFSDGKITDAVVAKIDAELKAGR